MNVLKRNKNRGQRLVAATWCRLGRAKYVHPCSRRLGRGNTRFSTGHRLWNHCVRRFVGSRSATYHNREQPPTTTGSNSGRDSRPWIQTPCWSSYRLLLPNTWTGRKSTTSYLKTTLEISALPEERREGYITAPNDTMKESNKEK